jgi:deoxyadenosine/deoxycytidine kinase
MAFSKPLPSINIYIEGNIAVGKSTFLSFIKSSLSSKVECVPEPLHLWTNFHGNNLLASSHSNPPQAFLLQTYIQLTMARIHMQHPTAPIRVMERSLLSERRIFIEALKIEGLLTLPEYLILDEWYKFLTTKIPPASEIIYLRSNPDIAFQRLLSRNRLEEKETKLAYIHLLHKLYESWLNPQIPHPFKLTIIDCNQELSLLKPIYNSVISRLKLQQHHVSIQRRHSL